jgi:hypothetical protein
MDLNLRSADKRSVSFTNDDNDKKPKERKRKTKEEKKNVESYDVDKKMDIQGMYEHNKRLRSEFYKRDLIRQQRLVKNIGSLKTEQYEKDFKIGRKRIDSLFFSSGNIKTQFGTPSVNDPLLFEIVLTRRNNGEKFQFVIKALKNDNNIQYNSKRELIDFLGFKNVVNYPIPEMLVSYLELMTKTYIMCIFLDLQRNLVKNIPTKEEINAVF